MVAPLERDSLSAWESEGGSTGESRQANVSQVSRSARFLMGARAATIQLTVAIWQQARRRKLGFDVRRLESRLRSEKDAIGQVVFPLIEAGTLTVELPAVHEHMNTIRELRGKIGRRTALATIDRNATAKAAADQSAKDAGANESQSPAEQGGQG